MITGGLKQNDLMTGLTRGQRRYVSAAAVILWLGAVVYGFLQIWNYSTTAGAAGPHPEQWPVKSALPRKTGEPTLLLFVHPRCPCSRASLAELAWIARTVDHPVDILVVLLRADETLVGWERTSVWTTAQGIPQAHVVTDIEGAEAARFGAFTSGQVLLYDAAGELLFAGGITVSRGHEGNSPGRRDVLALLGGLASTSRSTAVYGCPLADPVP